MATIISIETSTEVCSVALSSDSKVIWSKEQLEGQAHSTLLATFLKEMNEYIQANSIKVDAIAVSGGPGSYTGLRIGVSTAKGLCYGMDKPLIAIDTLKAMAYAAYKSIDTIGKKVLFCPMIDARRMEVYTAFFDSNLSTVRPTSAEIIDGNSFLDLLDEYTIYFFGNGANKCKSAITHANAVFLDNIVPLACNMVPLATEAFQKNDFKDVAYYEPAYLKEFIATVSKNKVIGLENQK